LKRLLVFEWISSDYQQEAGGGLQEGQGKSPFSP